MIGSHLNLNLTEYIYLYPPFLGLEMFENAGIYSFQINFVIAFLFMGSMFVSLFVFGRYVFDGSGSALTAWNMVIGSTIPLIAGFILTIPVCYLSLQLISVVMWLSFIISGICYYWGIRCSMRLNDNVAVYVLTSVYLGAYLIETFAYFIRPKIMGI